MLSDRLWKERMEFERLNERYKELIEQLLQNNQDLRKMNTSLLSELSTHQEHCTLDYGRMGAADGVPHRQLLEGDSSRRTTFPD